MISVERLAERLVLNRWESPHHDDEIVVYVGQTATLAQQIGGPVIVAHDMRNGGLLSPAQSHRLTSMMRTRNARVLRAAFLMPASATTALQLERMIRDAGLPERRAFRSSIEMRAFIAEVATPGELRAFDRSFSAQP